MSLINTLTGAIFGGPEEDVEGDGGSIDHYAVRWMPWGTDGGFQTLEEWDDLAEPIDKEKFKWSNPDPDHGRYRLFAISEQGNFDRPADEDRWKWDVGKPSKTEPAAEPEPQQIRKLSQLVEEQTELIAQLAEKVQQDARDPDDYKEEVRAHLLARAVTNPQFMEIYGEKVYDWVLEVDDSDDDSGLGYSDFEKSPFSAIAYDLSQAMMHEPHKIRQIGENMGGGMGAFLDGLAKGSPAELSSEDAEKRGNEAGAGRDLSDIDGGPMTLDDLKANDNEEAAELAAEFDDMHTKANEAERPAGSGANDIKDVWGTIIDENAEEEGAGAVDEAENGDARYN